MRLDEFQHALQSLDPIKFEVFVVDLLKRSLRFLDIRQDFFFNGYQIDIAASDADRVLSKARLWLFEVKQVKVLARDAAANIVHMAHFAKSDPSKNIEFAFVCSGSVPKNSRELLEQGGIHIWDASKIGRTCSS